MAWPTATTALAVSAQQTVPAVVHGTARPDDAFAALASVVALVILSWLALVVIAAGLAEVLPRGGRSNAAVRVVSRAVTPAAVRRMVTAVVTAALLSGGSAQVARAEPVRSSGPVVTASATPPALVVATASAATDDSLDPGWVRPSTRPASLITTLDPSWGEPGRARAVYPEEDVVVRRGDSLWDIAARHLGSAATDAEIARAWPQWFTANRATIGPDPDRLTPGQRLRPPGSPATPASSAGGLS